MQFNHDTMDISPKWILTKEYKSRIIDFYILLDFLFIIILYYNTQQTREADIGIVFPL